MPIDLWKEVFMQPNPEPQHLELFIKMILAGPEASLREAASRVRYEDVPDAVVVHRDPVPLIAVASLYHPEAGATTARSLKVIVVEPLPGILADLVDVIVGVVGANVTPVEFNLGYGRRGVAEMVRRVIRVAKGLSPRLLDVTDAPGLLGAAFHRAGVRGYTVVRRKGYEVVVEKVQL